MAKRFLLFALLGLLAAIPGGAQAIGSLQNGVYHHNATGVQFTLPPDWVIVSQGPASSGAQTVTLRDTVSNEIALVWLKARTANAADIPAMLDRRLDSKTAQRNNFEGYRYRPESVLHTTIGGRAALSAVADYVSGGQKMVEYITWVDGEKSRVLFSTRVPETALAGFQSRLDSVIQSVAVP